MSEIFPFSTVIGPYRQPFAVGIPCFGKISPVGVQDTSHFFIYRCSFNRTPAAVKVIEYVGDFSPVSGSIGHSFPHVGRDITEMEDISRHIFCGKDPCRKAGRFGPYPVGVKQCLYLGERFIPRRIISGFCFILQLTEQRNSSSFELLELTKLPPISALQLPVIIGTICCLPAL